MVEPLKGPDGRPIAKTLVTVAKINYCGGCEHAALMPNADGQVDINLLTCLEGPPQIVHIPVMRPGPRMPAPGIPGGSIQGPPTLVGMQEMSKYPQVGRNMRACARWKPQSDAAKAAAAIDNANDGASNPIESQKKN